MPTLQQIQQTILSAQYLQATLVDSNRVQLSIGNGLVKWGQIKQINRNQIALGFQVNREDYISDTTLSLYDCLNTTIGLDPTNNTIDPNFQNPNIIIDITGGTFAPPVITQIIGGVTLNPITVPYTGFTNPTLIYRNADGSNYNGAVNNVDTGSAIILTGDSNDGVTFADSFEFVIKQ